MLHLLVTVSKYTLIVMIAFYTYFAYRVVRPKIRQERRDSLYKKQRTLIFLILLNANAVLFFSAPDKRVILMTLCEIVYLILTFFIYRIIYKGASLALVNHMCLLLAVGFIILTRLDLDKAVRQFMIAVAALILTCLIPFFVRKMKFLNKLSFVYAVIGILGLGAVAIGGTTEYGAKLNLTFGGITIQPSEFIKIFFVFFLAAVLYQAEDIFSYLYATAVAMLHGLLLVASRDLGGAAIFMVTFLVMLYVSVKKWWILAGGLGLGAVGFVGAYFMFSHVQNRVIAWWDPLSVIDNEGYQVTQSLFAIGSGGWFGSGLYEGMPQKIPVVTKDFVFSAISEEMGGLFALCLILIYLSCLLIIFNIALEIKDDFYKLVAMGLGTVFGFQVFLTLGGVIKLIPSTGVTLPLISYGGSSLLSVMILFAVVQGLYLCRTTVASES